MKRSNQIFVLMVTLALVTLACDVPFMTAKQAPFATPSTVPSQPTKTLPALPAAVQPSSTSSPEPAISPTALTGETQAPAYTPVPTIDLSPVLLKIDDFPPGFTLLDSAAEQQIGVTQDKVAGTFQGMFVQARSTNYFAFLNPASTSYQLVFGTLFSPLTEKESAAFDQEMNDPAKATQSFTVGAGSNAELIAGASALGEKSIGFTFTTQANSITLRSDELMVRRGSVVILLISMYQDGTTPDIDAISLVTILDGRLKDALPH
jgi:hypothetical protein